MHSDKTGACAPFGSVPLVGLSTCGEAVDPIAKPFLANPFYRETALHVEGAWLHAGKPELPSIKITANPIAASVLVLLTRDDEYRMTIYSNHIYLSLNLDILPPVKLGLRRHFISSQVWIILDHGFFPTLSQWVMTTDPS